MDLDPRAVELPLDRGRMDLRERGADVGRGLGEHRLERMADPQAQRREPRLALRQGDRRDGAEVAAEHERAPHRGELDVRRLRDRVGHHARERALAQVAGQQPDEEPLLGLGRAGHEVAEQAAALGDGARARARPDPLERGVDVGDRQVRCALAAGRGVAERGPADADLPLAQFAGQERDAGGDLGGVEPAQRGGQVGDLLAARGRCADSAGRFDEFGEEHNSILAQRVTAGQNERMFGTLFRSPAVRPRARWLSLAPNSTERRLCPCLAPAHRAVDANQLHLQPKVGIIPSITIGYPSGGS